MNTPIRGLHPCLWGCIRIQRPRHECRNIRWDKSFCLHIQFLHREAGRQRVDVPDGPWMRTYTLQTYIIPERCQRHLGTRRTDEPYFIQPHRSHISRFAVLVQKKWVFRWQMCNGSFRWESFSTDDDKDYIRIDRHRWRLLPACTTSGWIPQTREPFLVEQGAAELPHGILFTSTDGQPCIRNSQVEKFPCI